MTENEIKALDYVRGCITRGGFSPKLHHVAEQVGLSKTSAHRIIGALVESGYLRRKSGPKSGLELVGVPDLRSTDSEALRAELARRGEIGGAFSRPERRAVHGRAVTCAADCCTVEVRPGHAFCLLHWRAISEAAQSELLDANRAARMSRDSDDAARYQAAFGRALDEANRCGGRN